MGIDLCLSSTDTDEEFARFERIMERRSRAAAPAIAAPRGAAPAQSTNYRPRCLEIPLDVRVCIAEKTEGKMEPVQRELESLSAGKGLKAPGQRRLSSWEMQRTIVNDYLLVDGSTDLGEATSSLEDFAIGVQSNNQTFPVASSQKILFLQMSCKPEDTKELANEENKQFDPGG